MVRRRRPVACLAVLAAACATAPPAGPPAETGSDGPATTAAPDDACLAFLVERQVPFRRSEDGQERPSVRTPVEIAGPLEGVALVPRGGRPALMDCELARALVEAAPLLLEAGIDRLSYSGAYDHRTRRGSSKLSAHAYGLAIDVHAFDGPAGALDVARDFETGAGSWRGLRPQEGDVEGCIGAPRSEAGRRLRALVCRLKHHSAFRVVVTPDDDADHRDHVHLEAFPNAETRVARVLGVLPLRR